MCRKLVNRWLDTYTLSMLKLFSCGYRQRLGSYQPAAAVDPSWLGTVEEPQRIIRRPEPSWHGWRVESFQFDSPALSAHAGNRRVSGLLLYAGKEAPWVVIVPGYATGAIYPYNYGLFQDEQAAALLENGLNVALIDLPYHRSRRQPGGRSGEGFFSPNLAQTQSAVLQGTADVIALSKWLRRRSGRPVGLWGTSLGGCIAGMTATVLPELGALVLMEPLDNPGDVMAAIPASHDVREELARHGITAGEMAEALRSVAPSTYPPRLSKARMLFITPLWDRVVPTRFQVRFWEAWDKPERILLESGHITMPFSAAANRPAAAFLTNWLFDRTEKGGMGHVRQAFTGARHRDPQGRRPPDGPRTEGAEDPGG